eukprot:PLAT8823.1.p1 GENE.PLAT8823.1~~PLAT8823.1.p1  ORF type:complete len:135 (+),score=43.50 PLAT8823.1:42-407(+)
MASPLGKILAQVLVTGGQVFGRAVAKAYQEALKNAAKGGGAAAAVRGRAKMSTSEALRVLDLEDDPTREEVEEAYEKLFEKNDPSNGSSFYLQSKVYRAKEAMDLAFSDEEPSIKTDKADD